MQKERAASSLEDAPSTVGPSDPAFGYFGSKHKIAGKIADLLPPHNAWVEAFCGSAAVTLRKAPAKIEIINDLDDQIVNLFQQLRTRPKKLLEQVALTPYSRSEYLKAWHETRPKSDLERARRFLVASMMTVNGSVGSDHAGFSFSDTYERGGREARVNRWYQLPDRLAEVVERLRSVRVEKIDAIKLLKNFSNRPGTLVYLDPPYLMDREHGYAVDANCKDFHAELLAVSKRAKCMVIVSGYKNPLYSRLLTKADGWVTKSIAASTRTTDGIDLEREELLWMNEPFRRAARNRRVPVSLSATERRLKKVNPKRR